MSSNSADQPNTSAAREPEGHSSWFHRPLTIKDGLILLPLASIPYFLIVKRFHALNMELTQLRRASLDFANELRKTRDTTSRPPDVVVSGQSSPSVATSYPLLPPESMESLRSQLVNLHDLAWKVQKTGSVVIKQNDRIMLSQRNIMQSQRNAKVALTSWETQARIWRDKTSRHILGLYKLKGESNAEEVKHERRSSRLEKRQTAPRSWTALLKERDALHNEKAAPLVLPPEPEPTEPPKKTTSTKPSTPPTEPSTPPVNDFMSFWGLSTPPPTEPSTLPAQPATPPTEPFTPPTEPSTPPTEPFTPPTEPSTPPTEPFTPPTEPSTPPTEPFTPPTEPSTPPTEPFTPPTKPFTPPTEPSTLPAETATPPTELDPTSFDIEHPLQASRQYKEYYGIEPDEPLLLGLLRIRRQLLKRMATAVYHQRVTDPEDFSRHQELAREKQVVKSELENIEHLVRRRQHIMEGERGRRHSRR